MSDEIKDLAAIRALAIDTLQGVCDDRKAPANARAMAARTLLELLGEIGRLQEQKPSDTKSLHEMTPKELDAEIARLEAVSKPMSKPGIRLRAVSKRKTPTKPDTRHVSKRPTLRAKRAKRAALDEEFPPWF